MTGNSCETNNAFNHPYKPYEIQYQFMNEVYNCLEDGNVGIFESPTGTGKSLSLICGSLTWLRDHKRKIFEEDLKAEVVDDDEPEWMLAHAREKKKEQALRNRAILEERLSQIRIEEKRLKERQLNNKPMSKRQKVISKSRMVDSGSEIEFLVDPYESDNNSSGPASSSKGFSDSNLSAETQALMKRLGLSLASNQAEIEEADFERTRIIFCSRTHSQLSQFAGELRKVTLPPTLPAIDDDELTGTIVEENIKHVTLASRKNLCIHQPVARLGDSTAINERCLELQKQDIPADRKCPFLPSKDDTLIMNEFRDHTLAQVRDIEDLGNLGKRLGICPYYASREVLNHSEIVTLPYPLLLQKAARDALNISVKGHVVIIDEAHNLMDAISGVYSVTVTQSQLQLGRAQLGVYLQKFRNRLLGKNRVYVTQIARLLDSMIQFLVPKNLPQSPAEGLVQIQDLMAGKGMDQVNLHKLMRYLQESKLPRKVDGYVTYTENEQENTITSSKDANKNLSQSKPKTSPVLTHIQSFLYALMNPSSEGKFFYSRTESGDVALKYQLVDPTNHFKDIVQDARAVILAGGTMSPMSDYEKHLLGYLPPTRIKTLSCGHVVPSSNLLAMSITHLNNTPFDFTFGKREGQTMVVQLGQAIASFIRNIPDGVVVFFPSHSYLHTCVSVWKRHQSSGGSASSNKTMWESMSDLKPIYLESANKPTESSSAQSHTSRSSVESLLTAYSNSIANNKGKGALLLAVIGGTLSEGINFSDTLGRGVIVVGLPFPNPHSAEWKAKLDHIDKKVVAATGSNASGKAATRDFYENACMRAVNQCIGRAIRHREDYAAIIMIDRRYGSERIIQKLPAWIRGSLKSSIGVEGAVPELNGFFKTKT